MDHRCYALEDLARTIKAARLSKDLSQRALSAKIDVPQGHISKIENGKVDIKASSLIELARALGLEVMLVPSNLVPAVNAFTRKNESGEERAAASDPKEKAIAEVKGELTKVHREAERALHKMGNVAELARLSDTARALAFMRMGIAQSNQIKEALKAINTHRDTIKNALRAHKDVAEMLKGASMRNTLKDIALAADRLKDIRNALAHGALAGPAKALPAYRLSDGGDDA
jgi:transcriptional regulator with XRE-family HTH domain